MSSNDANDAEYVADLRRRLAEAEQALERRERELSAERIWRRIVEELPIGINLYRLEAPGDAGQLRLIGINQAANEAVGANMEAFLERTLADSMPGALTTDAPHACVRSLENQQVEFLADLEYDDPEIPGAGRSYAVRTVPLSDVHVVVLFENVSELKRLNAERERRLQDLARANEQLARLDALKTRFFANVSHELRTPLTLISGPVQRLLRDADLSDRQVADLDLIRRNAQYLLRQVQALLDAARLDVSELEIRYSEADLATLVRSVCGDFEVAARDRGISLAVQAEATLQIQLDTERIRQVLLNLLSNALKFARGSIRVTLARGDGFAKLEVADDGPGVPEERRSLVFERFVRLDEETSGTGLGLTIARDLVSLHAGSIAMDSAPEGGALVTVTLPLFAPSGTAVSAATADGSLEVEAIESRARSLPAPHSAARADRPTIIVVEDNADMARFVASVLGDYDVRIAEDGREGLDLAERLDPDLVITDIMMPRMGGEQLIDTLLGHERLNGIPIIALTARASDDLRVTLLSRGAYDYLAKPFLPEELRARARNAIAVKRAGDILRRELSSSNEDVEALARELAEKKADLARSMASLAAALESAQKASAAKSTFLRLMSHEFNTPLQSLRLAVDNLQRQGAGEPPGKRVKNIARATQRLVDMIDGLLEFVRLEQGSLEIAREETSVAELVKGALEDFREVSRAKGIGLDLQPVHGDVRTVTDPKLLRMIVDNLVGNALKYTDTGSVRVLLSDDDALRIQVSDTGWGIPTDQQEAIFEPFTHLEPIGKKHVPGVGLGLALVREMVQSLGGEIALSSEVGAGSTFTVTLPKGEA